MSSGPWGVTDERRRRPNPVLVRRWHLILCWLLLLEACPVVAPPADPTPEPVPEPSLLERAAAWSPEGTDGACLVPSRVGDLDGDGFDDMAVGRPCWDGDAADQGKVVVLPGGPGGPVGTTIELIGTLAGDALGTAVDGGCDIDGDGRDDLVIGAPGTSDALVTSPGKVYVARGIDVHIAGTWPVEDRTTVVAGYAADDLWGAAVACGPDLDGDGRAEVAAGAPGADVVAPDAGGAWWFLGSRFEGAASLALGEAHGSFQSDGGDLAGRSLDWGGDLDGDGRAELVIGGLGAGLSGGLPGAMYVVASSDCSAGGAFDREGRVARVGEELGGSGLLVGIARSVGDLDGDGFGDLALDAGRLEANQFRGWVEVLSGRPGAPSGVETTLLLGWSGDPIDADHVRLVAAGPGDVDGDGLTELAVATPYVLAPYEDRGAIHLFSGPVAAGSDERLLHTAEIIVEGAQAGDHLGARLGAAGDVDGDGAPDLWALAPGARDGAGRLYLFRGRDLATDFTANEAR